MQKTCITCKTPFTVTDEEAKFIDKISPVINGNKYSIPLPENCPDCRLKMRVVHRNEQFFYQNKSAMSGQPLIALYDPNTDWGKNIKVYTNDEWWSDKWDAQNFAKDFDFNRPFFEQFEELNSQVPKQNLIQSNNENSPYTTGTGGCKNCHLISCSEFDEDCYYGKLIQSSRDIMDSTYVYDSELCYQCFNVTKCYNCNYVSYSQNCTDCWFCDDVKSCKNCFLCTNLTNKEYHFKNQPLSKEEYKAKINEYLSSAAGIEKAKKELKELSLKRIYKYANIVNCENSTGDVLNNDKNCTDCYDVNDSEDCKYVTVGVKVKDIMDCSNMYIKPELCYQVMGVLEIYNVIFSLYPFYSSNVMYSQNCWYCNDLFGCSGLKRKKFCILNKQFTEEEYKKQVEKIIAHMQKTGEWGQMFPSKDSPFGYNETVANEYLPLTREQALAAGYKWHEKDQREYKQQTYQVPAEIKDVKDDILNAVLACKKCGKNFRIITQELKRLKSLNLPVPENCPDCRHFERLTMRNARKLWTRKCDSCGIEMKTTFSPDRPEKVYCEKCYLKAVY